MSEIDRDAELESEADVGSKPEDEVKRWLKEIDLATEEEKDWREDVKTAMEVYCGEQGKSGTKFNIYHANIQTIIPSLYNSTPDPDVRRRHGDRDPVAKQSADVLERILRHEIDAYDFDGVIQATVQDMALTSRGIARVTYNWKIGPTEMKDEQTGEPVEDVSYQSVACQYVPWATFRRGPGRVFEDLPWMAFAAYYTKDGLRALIGKGSKVKLDKIQLDMRLGDEKEGAEGDEPNKDIFKRALVWEIWDKDKKRVLFVAPGYKEGPIRVERDPLELEQFFPIPKPMTGAYKPGSLIPICEHKLVKKLLDELDQITGRITALVKQLRVRGMIAGGSGSIDLQRWAEADDGDMVEGANLGAIMDKGSIENLIAWFPLDPTVKAVQALYEQRELVKQSIYEATGIADILRGQSDPNETLGAQQIKQQWGSLRIQKRQQEVQRFIRDLLRLKAELIANKFTKENLILASGLDQDPTLSPSKGQPAPPPQLTPDTRQLTPGMPTPPVGGGMEGGGGGQPMQAPPPDPQQMQMMAMQAAQAQEAARLKLIDDILALLRNDVLRSYRIDIETDSTIRGDLTKNQTAMAQFVQGSGQYFQALAPVIELAPMMMEAIVTIYSAFARNFKLGKQVDDILDKLPDQIKEQQGQQQPSPEEQKMQMEMEKMKAEMEMQQQKMQAEIQALQMKMGMEQQSKEADLQFKQAEHQIDIQAKQEDRQFERETMQQDRIFDVQGRHIELQAQQKQAQQDLDFKRATGQQQLHLAAQKAKQQKQQPKAQARSP